jgi:hypothetical protein
MGFAACDSLIVLRECTFSNEYCSRTMAAADRNGAAQRHRIRWARRLALDIDMRETPGNRVSPAPPNGSPLSTAALLGVLADGSDH